MLRMGFKKRLSKSGLKNSFSPLKIIRKVEWGDFIYL